MKQPEIKQEIIGALTQYLDAHMAAKGFDRPSKSLAYSRIADGSKQQLLVGFASNPSYARGMIAHLIPSLRIYNAAISDLALRLVSDPWLLAGAPEIIQNHRLSMVPKPQVAEWYVGSISDLFHVLGDIQTAFDAWGLPFLVDYSTPLGIVEQHEAGDARPLRQLHWYVYVIASYILIGDKVKAEALLEAKFGSPGIQKRYQVLRERVKAEQTAGADPAGRGPAQP